MAFKPFDLTGRVALVTGGNSGIGLGMAEAVASAGADVCLWGRRADNNAAAVASIAKHGTKVVAIECDVAAGAAAIDEAMARTVAELGRVDACFANAGVHGLAPSCLDIDEAEWRRVLGPNLDGAFFTLRAAARHMVARAKADDPGGRLIATSSLAAISGAARSEHYAATKGALLSIIRAMAVEFARYGITANAILPGWIDTEMTAPVFGWDKFRDAVLPRVPARRWGQPADFGGVAVYLMSDASAYHTGDSLRIDGGYGVF